MSTILSSYIKRDDSPTTTTSMPSLPRLSSEPSLSITSIPKNQINPYINVSNLPSNLVFIIVGSILGAISLGIILYRIITHYIYSSKAQLEKEIYYSTNTFNNFNELSSNYSFPIRSRTTSFIDSSSTSSQQGKSLQSHLLSDKQQFRKSMFLNPSLEYKSLQLNNNTSSIYLQNNNSSVGSLFKPLGPLGPYLDSNTITSVGESDLNQSSIGNGNSSVQTTLRPPSLYLEDLLSRSGSFNLHNDNPNAKM
ncbi:hypothetical protein KGF54_000396 [Candida jiufengensis]|uniref:uncharacterized protein n=1 Tax=Candida jiufengensis TaxID=497108 RepID=UPI00222479B0|nr:uncharacterized protein KGF54_000396 [Candida jiufengensis]KAI5956779.1 hypothetical protein KGF54_000396 [Candida jiufengensis]